MGGCWVTKVLSSPCSVKLTLAMCFLMDPSPLAKGFASTVWPWNSSQASPDCLHEAWALLPCEPWFWNSDVCLALFLESLGEGCYWPHGSHSFLVTWKQLNPTSTWAVGFQQAVKALGETTGWDPGRISTGELAISVHFFMDVHRWGLKGKRKEEMGWTRREMGDPSVEEEENRVAEHGKHIPTMMDETCGFLSKTLLTQPYNSKLRSVWTESILATINNVLPLFFVATLNFKYSNKILRSMFTFFVSVC